MSIQRKILLSNILLLIIVTLGFAYATDTWPGNGFFYLFGVICFAGAAGCLGLGALLLFRKDKRAAKTYLASAIVLLALGATGFLLLNRY